MDREDSISETTTRDLSRVIYDLTSDLIARGLITPTPGNLLVMHADIPQETRDAVKIAGEDVDQQIPLSLF